MAFAHVSTLSRIEADGSNLPLAVEYPVASGVTLFEGAQVNINSSGELVLSLATVGTAIGSFGTAWKPGTNGKWWVCHGPHRVSGFTGGTPGAALYVSEGAAGNSGLLTETLPATAGDVNNEVGYVITATEAILFGGSRPITTV